MPLLLKYHWNFHKTEHILIKNYKELGHYGWSRKYKEKVTTLCAHTLCSFEFYNHVSVSHALKIIHINEDVERTQNRIQRETTNRPHLLETNIHISTIKGMRKKGI